MIGLIPVILIIVSVFFAAAFADTEYISFWVLSVLSLGAGIFCFFFKRKNHAKDNSKSV